tara:strand:+ start:1455 stop:2255 length:801 start_codon:yes stop_codon:yes gene_type:complete
MNLLNGNPGSSISIFDRGFMYGDGVFETVLVKDGKPKDIDKHLERLISGCNTLSIKSIDIKTVRSYISKALSDETECILSIVITRGDSLSRGYRYNDHNFTPNIITITSEIPTYKKNYEKIGIDTKFSNYIISKNEHLSKIKHLNRLEQVMASKDISDEYPEVILCDKDDNIIEGVSSNIFFINSEGIKTPKILDSGVEGITRNKIIEYLESKKKNIEVCNIKKEEISKFKSAFFCNTVRGIWQINSIEKTKFDSIELINDIRANI